MSGRRVRLTAHGWERPLLIEAWEPEPPTGDGVLIRIEAASVCHRDLIDRDGRFAFQRLPITPGHESAGRVLAVGPGVTDFRIGDRVGTMHRDACGRCPPCLAGQTSLCGSAAAVLGLLIDGTYASHIAVPQSALFPLTDEIDAAEAATLHCTFGTALHALETLGGLRAGERVLTTGANGGVGAAAIQVARRLGADVTAVVRDERQREFVLGLGAHRVVVAPTGRWDGVPEVGQVDLALEAVGQPTFLSTMRSLRIGGRLAVVGNVVPDKVPVNLGYLITHGLTVLGGSGATRTDMARLLSLHNAAPFTIPVERRLPLDHADEAQRTLRGGNARGRTVLIP